LKKGGLNMKDETGRAKWEEFMNSELGQLLIVLDSDELFNLNLAKLKEFLQTHERLPVRIGGSHGEFGLANWIAVTKQNYRYSTRNLRQGSNCRAKWEEFIQQQ